MSATIVTLGGDSGSKPTIGRAATFEEAFGEYSDASGKRRKRKLERIADRREVKAEKQDARREKRGTRIANRDEAKRGRKLSRVGTRTELAQARQGRRGLRVDERQGRRDLKVERRQGRRTFRKGERVGRRGIGREDDKELELTETTTGTYPGDAGSNVPGDAGSNVPADYGSTGGYDPGKNPADEPTGGGSTYDDGQYGNAPSDDQGGYAPSDDQGGYAPSEEDVYDQGYQDELDESNSQYDESGYDESGYDESEDDGGYEGEYEDEYTEELDAPFDGVLEDSSDIDDSSRINAGLQDTCNKIEWNKTLVKVLENKRKKGNENKGALSRQILDRKKRIAQLESNVKSYEGAGADFSSADGMMMPNIGTPSGAELNRRTAETRQARRKAHRMMRQTLMQGRRSHGGNDTPVDVELNPSYGKQRIVVNPRFSNASGTGIIAIDDADDYDATELDVRMGPKYNELDVVDFPNEMFFNADGSTSKINWTGIAVGVAVGAVAVLLLRKYKILK